MTVRAEVRTVAKHLSMPLLGLVAGVAAAAGVTTMVPSVYQATASVMIMPSTSNTPDLTLAQSFAPTVARLAGTREVALDAANRLGVSPDDIVSHITGLYEPGIQIITINATAGSARAAADAANAAAASVSEECTRLNLGGKNPVLVRPFDQAGVPTTPLSPKPGLNLALGALVGVLIGAGVASLRNRIDDRFRRVGEIEAEVGLPVLGVVQLPARRLVRNVHRLYGRPRVGAAADAIVGALSVLGGEKPRLRVLVVGIDNDGPAVFTAALLSLSLSRHTGRTTLLEGPTGRPSARRYFPDRVEESVAVMLNRHRTAAPGADWLAVAPADAVERAMGGQNLRGERLGTLVDAFATAGDHVVVTGPPILSGGGVATLARHVDVVLVAIANDRSARAEVHRAAILARRLQAPVVGLVVVGGAELDGGLAATSWPEALPVHDVTPVDAAVPRPTLNSEQISADDETKEHHERDRDHNPTVRTGR